MRLTILALAGMALTSCDYMPALPGGERGTALGSDTLRRDEFVALIAANGCRLDQSDNEAVLVPAGFSDEEAGRLGGLLLSEGVAELSEGDGDLILLTENCV